MAAPWHLSTWIPLFSGNEGKGTSRIRSSVNTSERGKESQNPITMHSVLQGDNYFLLPSSVTLPAAPSLETLHGTHRSKTKHERRGSESVRLKENDVSNSNKKKKPMHKVCTQSVEIAWKVGMGTRNPFVFSC